ncbi:MAG TPA: alpha/beta hydrolase [Nevskiaceae bacterium]|nr:alpha/beta hydrolase [Nevskiaceae bacterium]
MSLPVPEGRYVTLPNGRRIHYLDHGQGEVVVFLHGSGSGACGYSNFKGNFPALVEAGYRTILPDLIGYGYSDKPADVEYPLDFFIECVKQTLDAIGVDRYTLVGNSLGGAIALGFALKHPANVAKLVLMAPGGVEEQADYFHMPGMAMMKEVFMSPEPVTPERMKDFFRKAFVVDPAVVDDALVNERHALMQLQNPQVVRTMKVPNMTARLGEIRCPSLGFWGMNEQMMPETGILRLAKGIPNLRMILVPNAGHWVMIEHRDLFNRMTLDFLRNG